VNAQTWALLPLLITTATVVAGMVGIAVRRAHRFTAMLTTAGIGLALASLAPEWFADDSASIAVTGLLVVDGIARFAMTLILITTLGVLTLCPAYFSGYRDNREELYLLIGVGTVGALTLATANHAATLLLGLELLSLPMVAAVAYTVDRPRSIEGGVKYLVLSAAASATLLFGVALIYAESGSLDMEALATAIAGAGLGSPLVTVGALMVLAGIAFKLSFVPFHQWTPDVYEAAPLPVTAYLATVVKLGAFVAALRLLHAGVGSASPLIVSAIVVLALASMLLGSLLALKQTNLKRLLAYSSIANFGFLAVVLALPGHSAVRAAGVYLVGYMIASLGIFGVMTLVSSPMGQRDHEDLDQYRGLFWRAPFRATVLITMLLSLAGIPLTAGFIGKLAVLAVGVKAGQWWLVGGVVLASAIGVFYYLRVVNALLTASETVPERDAIVGGWGRRVSGAMLLLAMIATLWLGVFPESLFTMGRQLVFP
jgi:NADH-quinone oxidoreductase subunit N